MNRIFTLAALTLAWQYVDNTGHRFSDGFLLARGQSVTQSALVEMDYGVTDRLSATAGSCNASQSSTFRVPEASPFRRSSRRL